MMSDRIRDQWVIDLAARTAHLGTVTVTFTDSGNGKFTATLNGAEDANFRLRLNLFWQASEAFENAWFRSLQKQPT